MLILDMRAFFLRTIFTHKQKRHLFALSSTKHTPFPCPSRISFQNPQFSRLLHSTNLHSPAQDSSEATPSEESKSRRVWTLYDPVSDGLITKRVSSNSDGQELEQSSGSETDGGLDQVDHFPSERTYGSLKKAPLIGSKDLFGRKRKGKGKSYWVCSDCGHTEGQWWGMCRSCNASSSMKQFYDEDSGGVSKASGLAVSENLVRSWLPQNAGELRPLRLTDVNRGLNHLERRIPL